MAACQAEGPGGQVSHLVWTRERSGTSEATRTEAPVLQLPMTVQNADIRLNGPSPASSLQEISTGNPEPPLFPLSSRPAPGAGTGCCLTRPSTHQKVGGHNPRPAGVSEDPALGCCLGSLV